MHTARGGQLRSRWRSAILLAIGSLLGALPLSLGALDVKVSWSSLPATYNPSLVQFHDTFVSALKRTTFKRGRGKTFWVNHLYICTGPNTNLQGLSCSAFNPWPDPYPECEFDVRVRGGNTDVTGLGDVKVWVWSGKGVFAIFGRKAKRIPGGGLYCTTQVVYDQWIAPVRLEPSAGVWALQQPLRLYLAEGGTFQYDKSATYIFEKNWMPWLYTSPNGTEHLYVTHMVQPHRILEVTRSGACEQRYETAGAAKLFAPFAHHSVHGGPPVVRVEPAASSTGKAYYLGIMHHIEKVGPRRHKLYRHFAYKFDPEPPFRITAVSDELNLTFYRDPEHPKKHYIAYVAGLFLSSNGTVYISYGAGDREPRVLTMTLRELEGTFTGRIAFLQHASLPG